MPEVTVEGDLPRIIRNTDRAYLGDLVTYFRILFERIKSNENPYHNFRHTCHVLWVCYQTLCHPSYRGSIPLRRARNLMVAALFHDFDHSGVVGDDQSEVDRAISTFARYSERKDRGRDADEIILHMRSTLYPHRVETKDLSLESQILRDADLSQCLSSVWVQQTIFGLAREVGVTRTRMLENQIPFLNSLTFSTDWARETFNQEVIAGKVREVRALLLILS